MKAEPFRLPVFHCRPLSGRMGARACAARHAMAKRHARSGAATGERRMLGVPICSPCRIGAAHLRGDVPEIWPDGIPVDRSTLEVAC